MRHGTRGGHAHGAAMAHSMGGHGTCPGCHWPVSVGSKICLVPAGCAPEQASGLLCSGTGPRQPPACQLVPEQASSLQAASIRLACSALQCTGTATGSCWLLSGNIIYGPNTCNQAEFFAAHPCMAATLATFVKQCWNHVCLATAAQKRPSNLLSGYLYFQ